MAIQYTININISHHYNYYWLTFSCIDNLPYTVGNMVLTLHLYIQPLLERIGMFFVLCLSSCGHFTL